MNRTTPEQTTPTRRRAWRPGPFLLIQLALHRSGLQLVSWTRRGFDTREQDAEKVLQRLTRQLAAGDILLLHDGNAARTPVDEALIVTVLPRLLYSIRVQGLTPVTLAHACNLH